jgi:hypothetical protein
MIQTKTTKPKRSNYHAKASNNNKSIKQIIPMKGIMTITNESMQVTGY